MSAELCVEEQPWRTLPIAVRVVSEEEFNDWLAKTKAASAKDDPRHLAAAQE